MTTALDLINLASKLNGYLGQGQTLSAEDANDALTVLNGMIAQWQRKRWLVYSLNDAFVTATGATSYTVGTGGDFNIPRPDKLESVFGRLLNNTPLPVDYPLDILYSREDYNRIALKSLVTFPQVAFYDAQFPLANLYIWPIPNAQWEIHIAYKTALNSFTGLTAQFQFPPEYQQAILFNLALKMRPMYGLPPDPTITSQAKEALNVIRIANAQVPSLTTPTELSRGGFYNIYGDQIY